jgi:hypothetical protein
MRGCLLSFLSQIDRFILFSFYPDLFLQLFISAKFAKSRYSRAGGNPCNHNQLDSFHPEIQISGWKHLDSD